MQMNLLSLWFSGEGWMTIWFNKRKVSSTPNCPFPSLSLLLVQYNKPIEYWHIENRFLTFFSTKLCQEFCMRNKDLKRVCENTLTQRNVFASFLPLFIRGSVGFQHLKDSTYQ